MNTRLGAVPTRHPVWLLPVAFALHELEEWNIVDWYRHYWTNVDPEIINEGIPFLRFSSWLADLLFPQAA